MKRVVIVIALLMLAAYGGLRWGASRGLAAASPSVTSAKSDAGSTGALPPSAVLRIEAGMTSAASGVSGGAAAKGRLPPVLSPLLKDYLLRKDFPALLAAATNAPNDAESLFLRAQILESCATRSDQPAGATPRKTPAERRQEFVASLSVTAPDTAQRIAAFDASSGDLCGSIRSIETSSKDINDLRARAVELKDPAALARELNCEIFNSIDLKANGNNAAEITESRFERIRQAINSRNPIAVRTGVGMLANNYRNGVIQIGPDAKHVNVRNMFHAANILACQYGADCNVEVLRACAKDGKCAANNFEDYLAFYELSPNDAQTVESYRAQLTQMIDTGDFSALQLVKGDQPTDSVRSGSYFSCAK